MDHTQLECLQRCEQEMVYRHVRHLTSAEESIGAFFGRVVHEGVRVLYDAEVGGSGVGRLGASPHVCTGSANCEHCQGACDCSSAQQVCKQEPADLGAAACHTYWQRELASGVRLPGPGSKPDFRTPALAAAIVRLYAARYPPASRGYSVVLNERYLASGEECGIVDRVVRRDADGLLYVPDLKTSSWAPNKS